MESEIQEAATALLHHQVIIYPTETIPGIGCIALNKDAIKKIFQIKERDPNKAMLVLVKDLKMIEKHKLHINTLEKQLLMSEEPTTVIIDHVNGFPEELTGPDSSGAFRITRHPICRELIRRINQPLVSTSANISGESAASTFYDLSSSLKKKVNFIMKNGYQHTKKSPSCIVKVENNSVKYIRK